jgi:hypothetical protein
VNAGGNQGLLRGAEIDLICDSESLWKDGRWSRIVDASGLATLKEEEDANGRFKN